MSSTPEVSVVVPVFDEEGALDRFEAFASLNGPAFSGLPVSAGTSPLDKRPSHAPDCVAVENDNVVVFGGGAETAWSLG